LARTDVYTGNDDAGCLECGWDAHDYAAIEQAYPCSGAPTATPSATPAALGALAAAMQALECARFLGNDDSVPPTRAEQIVIGSADHCYYRTTRPRNRDCRLETHEAWTIEPLSIDVQAATLRDLLSVASDRAGATTQRGIRIEGKYFMKVLRCAACDTTRPTLRLVSVGMTAPSCARCGTPMPPAGVDLTERLEADTLSAADGRRLLTRIGIRAHEIVSIESNGASLHFELIDHSTVAGVA
jgi:hypothetical protein